MTLRTYLIDTPEKFAGHEGRWESLRQACGAGVYSSWFLTQEWMRTFRETARPRTIMVEDGNELVGIAPLAAHTYSVGRIPVKVLALAGRVQDRLFISPSTILYLPQRTDVLDKILGTIKALDWSVLSAVYMENSPASSQFIDRAGSMWRREANAANNIQTIALPGTGDIADLFEKGARKNFHKRWRALERDGHKVELRKVPGEDIGRAVDLYARQHIERWEARGGSYFRNPENVEFLKAALREADIRRKCFVYELLIDEEVAAQNFGFIDGVRASSYRLGMGDSFMRYSPGWMIKYLGLTDLRDSGVSICDLGLGDEKFKQEMGGTSTPLLGMRASRGAVALLNRAAGAAARVRSSPSQGSVEE